MIEQILGHTLLGIPEAASQSQRDINDALLRYFALKRAGELEDKVVGGMFSGRDLAGENAELDIMLKKRQLGILNDSDELNESINTPGNRILAALGINFGNKLGSLPSKSLGEKLNVTRSGFPRGGGHSAIFHDIGHDLGQLLLRRRA